MDDPQVLRHAGTSAQPLSIDAAVAAVSGPRVGGIAVFIGTVRDLDSGQDVASLDYTAHPSAEAELQRAALAVIERHELLGVHLEHRVGHLDVGELAVVVAVSSMHRKDCLEACHELIDEVKRVVPIWKEQFVLQGGSHWVGA